MFRLLAPVMLSILILAAVFTSAQSAGGVVTPGIAAGKEHTIALRADGTVWAWGDNSYGQLGDGTIIDRSRPVRVKDLDNVISVAVGDYHSLALLSDGTVWAWGDNSNGQLAITRDEQDTGTLFRAKPEAVKQLNRVTAIAAGAHHCLALRTDGTVRAWGNNSYGQLGDGTTEVREAPRQVTFINTAQAICANGFSSAALMADGTLRSWGANWYGMLGDGRSSGFQLRPVRVPEFGDLTAIAMGQEHMLAVKKGGSVWAWGNNSAGQLGDGTRINRLQPVKVLHVSDAVGITAGEQHSLALTAAGVVWGWGDNSYHQIGDGTTLGRPVPVQLPGLQAIISVTAGQDHSLALAANGVILGWGSNWSGQLGDGTTEQKNSPVQALLNVYGDPFRIPVSGLALSPAQLVMQAGSAPVLLKADILPENASDRRIRWFSSNSAVVAVTDGSVRPLGTGTAEIYARTLDGDFSAVCTVTVVDGSTPPAPPPSPVTPHQNNRGTPAPLTVRVNDLPFTMEQHFMEEGRLMVPLRCLANALGAGIAWDGKTAEALLIIDHTRTLRLAAGRNEVRAASQSKFMLYPSPQLVDGRVYVPLRSLAELIGAEIKWQTAGNIISINYAGKQDNF